MSKIGSPLGSTPVLLTKKDGSITSITLTVEKGSAHPKNSESQSGFVYDTFRAYEGDECIGYLRTRYFTNDSFIEHNLTMFHYLKNFEGWDLDLPTIDLKSGTIFPDDLSEDQYQKLLDVVGQQVGRRVAEQINTRRKEGLSRQEMIREIMFMDLGFFMGDEGDDEPLNIQSYGVNKRSQWHYRTWCDKPRLDYVTTRQSDVHGVDKDYSGEGVGAMLYLSANEYYSRRNMQLHSGMSRTPGAQAVWESMRKKGWAEEVVVSAPQTAFHFNDNTPAFRDLYTFEGRENTKDAWDKSAADVEVVQALVDNNITFCDGITDTDYAEDSFFDRHATYKVEDAELRWGGPNFAYPDNAYVKLSVLNAHGEAREVVLPVPSETPLETYLKLVEAPTSRLSL